MSATGLSRCHRVSLPPRNGREPGEPPISGIPNLNGVLVVVVSVVVDVDVFEVVDEYGFVLVVYAGVLVNIDLADDDGDFVDEYGFDIEDDMLDLPDDLPVDLPEVKPVDENGEDTLLLDLPDENGEDTLVDVIDELGGVDLLLVNWLVRVFILV